MTLKALIAQLEDVSEELREHYVPAEGEGGGFVLDSDESEYKKKLDEFRNNNRKLHREQDRLRKEAEKTKGIDPERYQEAVDALEKLESMEDSELLKEGNIDAVVAKRTEAMKKENDKQMNARQKLLDVAMKERDKMKSRLGSLLIDSEVTRAISKIGKPRQGALDDILGRAHKTWQIDEEGDVVPQSEGGETVYGTDGEPLTMEGWSADLLTNASHLFEGGGGGGGTGSKKPAKPGSKKTVQASDAMAFGKALEGVADGSVEVIQ